MVNPATTSILVVDDSSTMRKIMRGSLARSGFINVTEAGGGREALALMQNTLFDVVFTDWNMPDGDGLEMIKQVRQMPNYKTVPVIMVTTEQRKEDIIMAMRCGINAYIVKPFTPRTIKEKLDSVLGVTTPPPACPTT